jgi:hypothetical protein
MSGSSWWSKLWRALEPEPVRPPAVLPSEHTCVHEAGHYMAAWLFPGALRINELNVNKATLPDQWNGGLHMTNISKVTSAALFDKMLLTVSAGIVATTIHTHGRPYVEKYIASFPYNDKLLDSVGGQDDYEMMKTFAHEIAAPNGLDRTRVIWNAFQTIFVYLMDPAIWEAVKLIAAALKQHRELRMSHREIEKLLSKKIGLKKLKAVREAFVAYRYPLSGEKITRLII